MPEFILDTAGRDEGQPEFTTLDPMVKGYIEALFFTEEDHLEEARGGRAVAYADLHPDALKAIQKDIEKFRGAAGACLSAARIRPEGYDDARVGRDFWYTRNGHGVGFWDLGLGEVGERLSALCGYGTDFPPVDAYVGDDGFVHLD